MDNCSNSPGRIVKYQRRLFDFEIDRARNSVCEIDDHLTHVCASVGLLQVFDLRRVKKQSIWENENVFNLFHT